MFKNKVRNSFLGQRVTSLWSSVFATVNNNYQIEAVAKLEKFYLKWMVMTRNYDEYLSKTYRRKRLIIQLLLLSLEITLLVRGLLLMVKSDAIPRVLLGNYLAVLKKGELVFHLLITFFALLTSYLRVLILYQEKKQVLDWLWMLHPFAVSLTSLRSQDMTDAGYRKFRIQAIIVYKLMKLAHRLSFAGVSLIFLLFHVGTLYQNFCWTSLCFNTLWLCLTLLWLIFALASCMTVLCSAYMATLAFEIRYSSVTSQIQIMRLDSGNINVTRLYFLMRTHNRITKSLSLINKGGRYFTSIIFIAIPFIDLLMYMAFVTKEDVGFLSKIVLAFVAIEACLFVGYVLFRVALISGSAHRPYQLLHGLMKKPNIPLMTKLKLEELIASLCAEPIAIDIMAIVPITYYHFYILVAEAAGNFFLIADVVRNNLGI